MYNGLLHKLFIFAEKENYYSHIEQTQKKQIKKKRTEIFRKFNVNSLQHNAKRLVSSTHEKNVDF